MYVEIYYPFPRPHNGDSEWRNGRDNHLCRDYFPDSVQELALRAGVG